MSKDCFFSVIIPTFRRQKFLIQAIESVLKQTYNHYEIIVVDDSLYKNNDTKELILKATKQCKELKLTYIKNKKSLKAAGSRNKGAEVAQGDFLAFLDDDDQWDINYLKDNNEIINNTKAKIILSGLINWQWKTGEKSTGKIPPDKLRVEDFFLKNPGAVGSNIIIDKNVFISVGGFDERLLISEDKDLVIRLALNNIKYTPNKKGVVFHRKHDNPHLTSSKNIATLKGTVRFYNKYKQKMPEIIRKKYRARVYFTLFIHSKNNFKRLKLICLSLFLDFKSTIIRLKAHF